MVGLLSSHRISETTVLSQETRLRSGLVSTASRPDPGVDRRPDTQVRETVAGLMLGLVDDAAVFPPGNASVPDAVRAHRQHRSSWYADLVGPLLVRSSQTA